jgi:type VI secretion system protein ImpA
MPSPEVLDFAKLLAPITAENPTGSDIRADPSPVSDYQKIREARKAARAAEKSLDAPPDDPEQRSKIPVPDWGLVLDLGTKIIAEKSKDLEVAAYVIEAVVRQKKFAGLRDGYRLARELTEKFWDGLYPPPEPDSDTENRFKLLFDLAGVGVPGALLPPIRKIPMTAETSAGAIRLTHHSQALSLAKVADPKVRQQRIDKGEITLETIGQAIAETPAPFYAELVDDLSASITEINRFCVAMHEKSTYQASSSEIVGVLEEYLGIIKDLARDKLPKPQATAVVEPTATGQAPLSAQPAALVDPGKIRDRADALERLKKIADYFREHEPQSMIPFALDQAANWSRMSLPELLLELIPEESARKNLFKQVGIKLPDPKK